ncbi:hypothetical protein C9374_014429 [Naegleria lovaniensis]|uniref:Uncharacterized protein n=1 Tax=Naegleria lovaniensis TaxID=51637 RepID=A0AA88H0H2_NAELO|nr:uncharacterized protein C9374_014429 [Naegleria lovaniensis]KAG2389029.1 hypothetical protein C9374_014429 [Naegleria lovaniensis]
MKRSRNPISATSSSSTTSSTTAKPSSTQKTNREKFTQQLKEVKKRRGTSSSFSSKQTAITKPGDVDKKKRSELVKHFQANYNKRYGVIQYRYLNIKIDEELIGKSMEEIAKEGSEERRQTVEGLYSLWKRQYFVREIIEDLTNSTHNFGAGFDVFNFPNLTIELIHYILCEVEKKKDILKNNKTDQNSTMFANVNDIVKNFELPDIYNSRGAEDLTSAKRFHLSFVSGRTGKDIALLKMKADTPSDDLSEDLKRLVTHSSFAISRAVSVYELFQHPRLFQHFYDDYGNYTCVFSIHGTSSRHKSHPSTSFVKHKAQLYSAVKALALSNQVIAKSSQKNDKTSNSSQATTASNIVPSPATAMAIQPQPFLKIKNRLSSKNKNQPRKNSNPTLHATFSNANKKHQQHNLHSTAQFKSSEKVLQDKKKKRKMSENTASNMMQDDEETTMTSCIDSEQSTMMLTLDKTKEHKKQSSKVNKQQRKFNDYLPLHEMWKEYMLSMLGTSSLFNNELLLKADYHGCIFRVVKSRCGSYIGKEGMVIKETENTFQLLTRDDKFYIIPKNGSVFQFNFEKQVRPPSGIRGKESTAPPENKNYQIEIIGTQFCFRSYDRASKKFKRRDVIDL